MLRLDFVVPTFDRQGWALVTNGNHLNEIRPMEIQPAITPKGNVMRTTLSQGGNYYIEFNIENEKLGSTGVGNYFEKYQFTRVNLMTEPQMIGVEGKNFVIN